MAKIDFTCECGKIFAFPENMAGKSGKCPKCGALITIPAAASSESARGQSGEEDVPRSRPVPRVRGRVATARPVSEVEEESSECPKCGEPLDAKAAFCTNCGYRVRSARRSRPNFAREYAKDVHWRNLNNARNVILTLAIILAVFGVIIFFVISAASGYDRDSDVGNLAVIFLVMNLGVAGIYFGCWVWAKTNPVAATIVAMVLYITLTLVRIILDWESFVSPVGILVTVMIIGALAYGIKSALVYERMEKEDRRHKEMVRRRQIEEQAE